MPWTLYRYILRELLKVLVLTTAVMVVVLSFGAALGPIADGLLGPVELMKFVLYTMPTVLGFALPFAGAFSATVVFHGMVKDNEVLACRAGGMSYSKIFSPVIGLGFVLMIVLLLLSNTIVPSFWKAAKKTVEGDVLQILVNQLNQNRPYVLRDNGFVLYSDSSAIFDPESTEPVAGLIPEKTVHMAGVVFGQYDKRTRAMVHDTTASAASAELLRDPRSDRAYIALWLKDPVFFDVATGEFGRSTDVQFNPIELPNPIEDEPVFYDFFELQRLRHAPHDYDMVFQARNNLADAVAEQQLLHMVRDALSGDGPGFIMLKGALDNEFWRVSAPRVELRDRGMELFSKGTPPSEDNPTPRGVDDWMPVTVERFYKRDTLGEAVRQFEAQYAEVEVSTGRFDREPQVQIRMQGVRVLAINESDKPNEKREQVVGPMRYPERVLGADTATLDAEELNDWSQREAIRDAPSVQEARAWLRFRILQLKYMIDAELYKRLASALATPLLLLLGTLLAVRLRDRLPLVVFFWAFVLAIITLVMIHTGKSMAERLTLEQVQAGVGVDRVIGVAVLWGGDLLLLLVCARLYLKIARN